MRHSKVRRVDQCGTCGYWVTLCACSETPSEAYERGYRAGRKDERKEKKK